MTNRCSSRSVETDDLVWDQSHPARPLLWAPWWFVPPPRAGRGEKERPSLPVLAFSRDAMPGLPWFPGLGVGGTDPSPWANPVPFLAGTEQSFRLFIYLTGTVLTQLH